MLLILFADVYNVEKVSPPSFEPYNTFPPVAYVYTNRPSSLQITVSYWLLPLPTTVYGYGVEVNKVPITPTLLFTTCVELLFNDKYVPTPPVVTAF